MQNCTIRVVRRNCYWWQQGNLESTCLYIKGTKNCIYFSVLHNRLWGRTNQNTRIISHIVITWHIIETFNSLIRFCTGICFFYRVTIRCLTAYFILGFMVLRFPHFRFHFCFLLKTSSMFFFLWETACKNCISQTLSAYFVYSVDDVLIKKRN